MDDKLKKRIDNIEKARTLKNKGYSNAAIASEMGLAESSVRTLLKAE